MIKPTCKFNMSIGGVAGVYAIVMGRVGCIIGSVVVQSKKII